MARKGKFIMLEGIDGSGKSTQIKNVFSELQLAGVDVLTTREPYDEPENEIGFRVRQILLGKEENPGYLELQKMFVVARGWHLENIIIPAIDDGKAVLCDRYTASTYAYHRSKGGTFDDVRKWHLDLHHPADATILINVPVQIAIGRLGERERGELFDKEESLKAIHIAYWELLSYGDKYIPNFQVVNGEGRLPYVTSNIMDICKEVLSAAQAD